jgi:signal transduction histidine kinase
MTVIVIIFAIFSYSLTKQNIYNEISQSMTSNIAQIIDQYLIFDNEKGLSIISPDQNSSLNKLLQTKGQSLRIIDSDKNVIAQFGVFKTEIKPSPSKISTVLLTSEKFNSVITDREGMPLSYFISPIQKDNKTVGIIELSQPIKDSIKTLNQLVAILVIGVFATITLSLLAGYVLSRSTLGYVNVLIDNVEAISSANDLGQRLPVPANYKDEHTRLASTFNSLLDQIEKELIREKNFTANASHDLRTPITIIQGNIDLAFKKKNLSPSQISKTLSTIKSESVRMSNMINELLILSSIDKKQTGQLSTINIDNLLDEILDSISNKLIKKNISINRKKSNSKKDLAIIGNHNQIKRMFANLIDNAIKYNIQNGNIYVKTSLVQNKIQIVIQDTGEGIAASDLPYIFDRLYQSKKSRTGIKQGFGIGLSIVKEIIEYHHGKINVVSELKAGTKITIIFPQHQSR